MTRLRLLGLPSSLAYARQHSFSTSSSLGLVTKQLIGTRGPRAPVLILPRIGTTANGAFGSNRGEAISF